MRTAVALAPVCRETAPITCLLLPKYYRAGHLSATHPTWDSRACGLTGMICDVKPLSWSLPRPWPPLRLLGGPVRSDHERDIERSGAALASVRNSRPIRGGTRALQIGSPSFSCDYGAGFRTSENATLTRPSPLLCSSSRLAPPRTPGA